ncbi:MAG: DUF998 domain-containing protein [Candidatus Dormibacterales bacterium]
MNESVAAIRMEAAPACEPGARVTRSLLGYGVIAGPLYVGAVLIQSLFRPGFDLTRHDASLLSNGSLGWIQIANFVVTGLMVVACAAGIRRALAGGRSAVWGPTLLAVYGIGMIGAGIFVADPMNGFPIGAPAGRPDVITLHGMLHIVSAGFGFLAFVAACFVLARRFAGQNKQGWARFSMVTGVLFLAAFAGLASGSSSPVVVIAFWAALLLAWAWLGSVAVHLYRNVPAADQSKAA